MEVTKNVGAVEQGGGRGPIAKNLKPYAYTLVPYRILLISTPPKLKRNTGAYFQHVVKCAKPSIVPNTYYCTSSFCSDRHPC